MQSDQITIFAPPYDAIDSVIQDLRCGKWILLFDHIGGFDSNGHNSILQRLDRSVQHGDYHIGHVQVLPDRIKQLYPNLNIHFDFERQYTQLWKPFETYHEHPDLHFENFLCSFNGSAHVSRQLLISCIHRMGWFDHRYSSKNFTYTLDALDGHVKDLVPDHEHQFWRKFFLGPNSEKFFSTHSGFGHVRFEHDRNIHTLAPLITKSFLHLVSETLATSYSPFVTEKFLYSVVTRGLFLAYGQPGWHDHLCRYYGFRKYDRIFDYRFDNIQNPVQRLIELVSMISKFSVLSTNDWRDLYEMESDTIEYNYDHYFSSKYLEHLENTATGYDEDTDCR